MENKNWHTVIYKINKKNIIKKIILNNNQILYPTFDIKCKNGTITKSKYYVSISECKLYIRFSSYSNFYELNYTGIDKKDIKAVIF